MLRVAWTSARVHLCDASHFLMRPKISGALAGRWAKSPAPAVGRYELGEAFRGRVSVGRQVPPSDLACLGITGLAHSFENGRFEAAARRALPTVAAFPGTEAEIGGTAAQVAFATGTVYWVRKRHPWRRSGMTGSEAGADKREQSE
jgi:hypothetical protein